MNAQLTPSNREKVIPFAAGIAITLLTFLLLYQPWQSGLHDLTRAEGIFAAEAMEFRPGLPVCSAHGVIIRGDAPLYPLLAAGLHALGLPLIPALRLLSLAGTVLTATLVFRATRAARTPEAALIAMTVFLSFLLTVDKTFVATPQPLAAFGLLAAHLVWFHHGVRRGNWNRAWLASCAVMVPTIWAGGMKMLLFYLFPLIFMRRPLTIWPKLNRPGTIIGAVLIAAGLLLWIAPQWLTNAPSSGREFAGWEWDWLRGFPFDLLLRLLPWSLLLWIPFCAALHPLDATPIFGRFLRTISGSLFFLLWLSPGWRSPDMLFLAAPLAIQIGCGYELAARRYSTQIRLLGKAAALFTCLTAFALFFFLLLPEQLLHTAFNLDFAISFRRDWSYIIPSLAITAGLLAGGTAGIFGNKRNPVWLHFLFAAAAGGMFWWTVIHPYQAQDHRRAEMGDLLAAILAEENLPPDHPVYKIDIQEFYCEGSRLRHPIRKISMLNEIPDREPVVYLLATEFPQYPRRDWKNLLPAQKQRYFGKRLGLWRGTVHPENGE